MTDIYSPPRRPPSRFNHKARSIALTVLGRAYPRVPEPLDHLLGAAADIDAAVWFERGEYHVGKKHDADPRALAESLIGARRGRL